MRLLHAGYVVTRGVPAPPWSRAGVERVVSVSMCIARVMPDGWCTAWSSWTDEERAEDARALGLPHDRLDQAIALTTSALAQLPAGFPGSIRDLETARALCAFCADAIVVSLAVPADEIEEWLACSAPADGGLRSVVALGRPRRRLTRSWAGR